MPLVTAALPAGACEANITQMAVTKNMLALRWFSIESTHFFNGDWTYQASEYTGGGLPVECCVGVRRMLECYEGLNALCAIVLISVENLFHSNDHNFFVFFF